MLSNEADTADCFQRTFISSLELSKCETIRHWPALLRRLATARALEQLRGRLRDRNRFSSKTNEVRVDREVDRKTVQPDCTAAANELADHLRTALSDIDPRQAEVFCLACLDDCSYAEIAEQLETTSNNVGVLLNRSKMALRELLKAHDPQSQLASKKSERKP